jgi:cob(I)alamin adenosyltransferase
MNLKNKDYQTHKHYDIENTGEGLVLINTGNGKGKTTAALGLALRAAGHGMKVLVLQFIKSGRMTGEAKVITEKLKSLIDIEQIGEGFIRFKDGKPDPTSEQIKNARDSFDYARDKIGSGKYDLIVLDEINNLIDYDMLKVEEVAEFIKSRPEGLHLVLTGREAPPELIDIADTVTEMREIKHAFRKGIKARKGILSRNL